MHRKKTVTYFVGNHRAVSVVCAQWEAVGQGGPPTKKTKGKKGNGRNRARTAAGPLRVSFRRQCEADFCACPFLPIEMRKGIDPFYGTPFLFQYVFLFRCFLSVGIGTGPSLVVWRLCAGRKRKGLRSKEKSTDAWSEFWCLCEMGRT
nr:hypothetical protein [Pandoravirus massiliensis]